MPQLSLSTFLPQITQMSQILGLRTSYCYFADSLLNFSDLGCMQQSVQS